MEYKKGNLPLYFQFYLQLKNEIVTGDREPGTLIPTLNELSQETGISHGMIRKALELLESEGLIKKKQRVGTIVQENRDRILWTPSASLTEIRERVLFDEVNPISDGWIQAPNRIMYHFDGNEGVLKDGELYHLHFLLISKDDKRRRNLSSLFVPEWRFNQVSIDLLREEPVKTVVGDILITDIKQIIRPWFCDSYTSTYLQIPEGTPIFHRSLVSFFDEGKRVLAVLEQLTTVYALERLIKLNP